MELLHFIESSALAPILSVAYRTWKVLFEIKQSTPNQKFGWING